MPNKQLTRLDAYRRLMQNFNLAFPKAVAPTVGINVLVHNRLNYTLRCLLQTNSLS